MVCKGICVRHKALKPGLGIGRYCTGQKRCQICETFLKWQGIWCPCCGYRSSGKTNRNHPSNIIKYDRRSSYSWIKMRTIYRKATDIWQYIRNNAYIHFCICYDEIDSIAPTRGGAKSTDRMVA